MDRSDESETAEPQKESLSDWRRGQPRLRTSVAVSERAQQNDYPFQSARELKRFKGSTYQIQFLQPLCRIRQIDDGVIRQIRTIRQN